MRGALFALVLSAWVMGEWAAYGAVTNKEKPIGVSRIPRTHQEAVSAYFHGAPPDLTRAWKMRNAIDDVADAFKGRGETFRYKPITGLPTILIPFLSELQAHLKYAGSGEFVSTNAIGKPPFSGNSHRIGGSNASRRPWSKETKVSIYRVLNVRNGLSPTTIGPFVVKRQDLVSAVARAKKRRAMSLDQLYTLLTDSLALLDPYHGQAGLEAGRMTSDPLLYLARTIGQLGAISEHPVLVAGVPMFGLASHELLWKMSLLRTFPLAITFGRITLETHVAWPTWVFSDDVARVASASGTYRNDLLDHERSGYIPTPETGAVLSALLDGSIAKEDDIMAGRIHRLLGLLTYEGAGRADPTTLTSDARFHYALRGDKWGNLHEELLTALEWLRTRLGKRDVRALYKN